MDKGKLLYVSSPPSRIRIFLSYAYFIFIICIVVPGFLWAFFTTPDVDTYSLRRIIAYSGSIVVSVVSAFLMGISMMQYNYRVYENGLTLKYPNFLNSLFHKNKKEGEFISWNQMLGYVRHTPEEERNEKDGDVVTVFYWDYERLAIRMEMFGENLKDVDVVERELRRHGVKVAPRNCPTCDRKLLGFDYLYNRCEKCGTPVFELPEGAKIMPWIERQNEITKRRKEMKQGIRNK